MKARRYRLYGCRIESRFPLGPVPCRDVSPPQIRIFISKKPLHPRPLPAGKKIRYRVLPDGSVLIDFFKAWECRVAGNGRTVEVRRLSGALLPAFRNFLRSNALSFCLLKMGIESLHASAVSFKGRAVGFIGESGYGKSTLAASFLQAGFPILTDDLLAVRGSGKKFTAAPGIAHLKLFGRTARRFLPRAAKGTSMGPGFQKKVFHLKETGEKLLPLGALYVLEPRLRKDARSKDIRIRNLPRREAVIHLIRAAHNLVLQDPGRLKKQFFFAGRLASKIPVRAVSYPFDLSRIPQLRMALLRDMERQAG